MARFYLTLHECGWVIDDHVGIESPSLDGAREAAFEALKDLVHEEEVTGQLCLLCRIEILDAERRTVEAVTFADAVASEGCRKWVDRLTDQANASPALEGGADEASWRTPQGG